MSLELKIEALTAAVTALTAQLQAGNVAAPAPVAPAPAPVVQAAPVAAAPAPVTLLSETPGPVGTSMPAPPTFAAPVAAPAPTGAPFSDPKGLIDYVMGAYKALGPQKGALIQGVLTGLGYQNINDVKPEHYAALHTGVEALKG
jgi:hypothetical protein